MIFLVATSFDINKKKNIIYVCVRGGVTANFTKAHTLYESFFRKKLHCLCFSDLLFVSQEFLISIASCYCYCTLNKKKKQKKFMKDDVA